MSAETPMQPTTLELFADLLQAVTLERTESLMARSLGRPSMDRLIEDCTQALRRERAFAAQAGKEGK